MFHHSNSNPDKDNFQTNLKSNFLKPLPREIYFSDYFHKHLETEHVKSEHKSEHVSAWLMSKNLCACGDLLHVPLFQELFIEGTQ